MKKFSDFAKEPEILDGDKIRLDDVLNKPIQIIGYKVTTSKYGKNKSGKCLKLQFELDNERRVIFTGSDVLIDQLEQYGGEIPFQAVIKRIDRYYTLS
ncbi:hypothetical protein [Prosthecochloris sp.]|uniref:hypothetical protein n=1 Tax=Prosthecochloris sp. TaxID=290513 RepID=UPI00257C32B8|nr:hypothetical protein [Prosthecochloris sp.]